MESAFVPIGLGVFLLILGAFNRKGNLSSIHWYHRHRVTEENKLPFGRLVGGGTMIVGAAMAVFGILSLAAGWLEMEFLVIVGSVIVVIGIAAGLALSLYAMMKYNNGIF